MTWERSLSGTSAASTEPSPASLPVRTSLALKTVPAGSACVASKTGVRLVLAA